MVKKKGYPLLMIRCFLAMFMQYLLDDWFGFAFKAHSVFS